MVYCIAHIYDVVYDAVAVRPSPHAERERDNK